MNVNNNTNPKMIGGGGLKNSFLYSASQSLKRLVSKFNKDNFFVFFLLWGIVIFATLFSNCSSLLLQNQYIDDQQLYLQGAQHILKGDVLYKTFSDIKGPFQFFMYIPLAALGKLAYSHTLNFFYTTLIFLVQALFAYKLSRLFLSKYIAILPSSILTVFLIQIQFTVDSQNSIAFAIIYTLYIWSKVFLKGQNPSIFQYSLQGFFLGLAFWTSPICLGLPFFLFIFSILITRDIKYFIGLLISAVGFILSSLIILSYFIANNAVQDLLNNSMLRKAVNPNFDIFYSIFNGLKNLSGNKVRGFGFSFIISLLLILGLLLTVIFFFNLEKNNNKLTAIIMFTFLFSYTFAYIPFTTNIYYPANSYTILIFGIVYLIQESLKSNLFQSSIISIFVILFIVSNNAYVYKFPRQEDNITYATPLRFSAFNSEEQVETYKLSDITKTIIKSTNDYKITASRGGKSTVKKVCDRINNDSMVEIFSRRNETAFLCKRLNPWQLDKHTQNNYVNIKIFIKNLIDKKTFKYIVVTKYDRTFEKPIIENTEQNNMGLIYALNHGYKVDSMYIDNSIQTDIHNTFTYLLKLDQ